VSKSVCQSVRLSVGQSVGQSVSQSSQLVGEIGKDSNREVSTST